MNKVPAKKPEVVKALQKTMEEQNYADESDLEDVKIDIFMSDELNEEIGINRDVSEKIQKQYLIFRPYIDPMSCMPYKPRDMGYYYKFYNSKLKIIKYTFEDNGFKEVPEDKPDDWIIMWSTSSVKSSKYVNLNKFQKINHFPRSIEICRKDLMTNNLNFLRDDYPNEFDFFPKSYVIKDEYREAFQDVKDLGEDMWWIVKPCAAAQGKGIYFINKPEQLMAKQDVTISQYVNNPYLINGYKFDLRIYVCITSVNPLRLYMYEEGLVRFATAKYKPISDKLDRFSKYSHLTNYSVNKNNANFIENKDASQDAVGSKWSLSALWKHLKQ